ncbi:DUF998 domain-containing protein [Tsukamurella strandjordii]|uniref:DUF998 domain-containing protein n=1 Tax=Tsukamurella strandjordii TaxID=147577 RepID=A0AA90NCZ6_9ACTN|nr:DUF998 domain-containing protein [Tsukamurella strandjordii]MDP0400096.1 DUF998 domain-containing protein [Tsukamurella strandjordii]
MQRARLVIIAGAIFYSAWIFAPTLGSTLNGLRSYVSEVAATGQPYAQFFRATDLLAGTCFIVGAALWWKAARPESRFAWAWMGGMIVLGAATMCDALLPLSCTPTADATCAYREANGQVPFTHLAHAYSSGLAGTGGAVAVLAWGAWLLRGGHDGALRTVRPVTVVAFFAGLTYLIASVWTLAAMAITDPDLYLGVAQRLQIAGLTVWLVLIALPIPVRPPPDPPPPAPS